MADDDEDDVRVRKVGEVAGKPAWNGQYRFDGEWWSVRNVAGQRIVYASVEAAQEAARFKLKLRRVGA